MNGVGIFYERTLINVVWIPIPSSPQACGVEFHEFCITNPQCPVFPGPAVTGHIGADRRALAPRVSAAACS
jgi:hypothetical protein